MIDDLPGGCLDGVGAEIPEAIHRKWGWKGCAVALLILAALIGLAAWYFNR